MNRILPLKIIFSFLLLGAPWLLLSAEKVLYPAVDFSMEPPWLTGPLIAPSSVTVPPGSLNIEPYLFATAYTGNYNQDWKAIEHPTIWSNNFQVLIETGILSNLDIQIVPGAYWNYTEHEAHWAIADLPVTLSVQLYNNDFTKDDWIPSIKLILRELFPLGKYNHLDPRKLETDAGGFGSFVTGVGLVFGKLFHLRGVHFLNARFTAQYNLPSKVNLKGFNFYGGGYGTKAKYFPAQNFFLDLAFEYTLAQRWALALDLVASYYIKAHFSGFAGLNPDGTLASLATAPRIQYSIAPAIEYNWSANWGVIGGVWLSVAGRNSQQFVSGVIALNYYR